MIVKIELGNENLKKFLLKNIIKLNKNNSYQSIILTAKWINFNKSLNAIDELSLHH